MLDPCAGGFSVVWVETEMVFIDEHYAELATEVDDFIFLEELFR